MISRPRVTEPLLAPLLLYCCLLFHLCGGQCPQQGTPSPVLNDKIEGSEVVVQGQVTRNFKVSDKERSYSVELRVYCVYKGGPVPSIIQITGAGESPETCARTDLPLGSLKLVYLRRSGEGFTPTFAQDPAETKYLEELKYACGLSVQLPKGGGGPNAYCNPEQFVNDHYDDCQESTPPGAATTTRCSWTMVLGVVVVVLLSVGRIRLL